MEDQLEQAVNIAISGTSDASLKQQAIGYCTQVKESPDGWQVCLSLYTGSFKRSPESRFFALQVIDAALPRLSQEELQYVQSNLFTFVKTATTDTQLLGANYLKNKLAQTISFLFILSYQSTWTSFFDDFLSTLASSSSSIGNAAAVDIYLRILKVIHEEIGDNLILREPALTKRNNNIKDQIRDRDINKLTDSWIQILQNYIGSNEEIVEGVLKVIGGWVSWVDITLIINGTFVNLIYKCLQNEAVTLATCDTLIEVVSKKMKSLDKMELIRLLGLKEVISQLPADERVGKLANIVTLELVHILDGSTSIASNSSLQPEQLVQAEELLTEFFSIVTQYLGNEDVEISSQVLHAISEYLTFVRKESKQEKSKVDTTTMEKNLSDQVLNFPADSNFISPQRRLLLSSLLPKIILKMRYNDDDWEDEDFLELRGKLKLLQDQIASIDSDLYIDDIIAIVTNSFDPAAVTSWKDVELGLFELEAYSDSLKNGAINVIKGVETRPTQTLSSLFFKMIESNVVAMDHPSIQLHYIELVNRHCNLFNSNNSNILAKALETFVSPLGVHNPNKRVQIRSWYLLYRFIKSVRILVGDISQSIFTSIESLLEIKATLPAEETATDPAFDNQLYLFELCGLLLSSSSENLSLVKRILDPIFQDMEKSLESPVTPLTSLQIHHDLMAIGTFARGFHDYGSATSNNEDTPRPLDPWVFEQFNTATNVVTTTLERMGNFKVIRDAARFAIARLIPLLGMDILPKVTRLITCFLEQCSVEEMTDFLGFLGNLLHKFRKEEGMFVMFDMLMTPLFERFTQALNEGGASAAEGSTDAVILKRDLRRAYLQFIFNVLNNNMGAILFSDKNMSIYERVLQTVLLYASDIENGDDQAIKLAILVLNKMLQCWGMGVVKAEDFGANREVPGFEQFTLEHVSRICFEIPTNRSFNFKDSRFRGILGDLALLQYTIYEVRRDKYIQFLSNYFQNVGVPAEYAAEYLKQLSTPNLKAFKSFFLEFFKTITK
ncbi:similar to Saccharomyces cerevisiae YKL205W LOS1 Nuclear pore protein involved in nuclear export of pre-tRNA and in re-export of mature tRNAs after their retrograde import from the cytoplasm [Geotrichum candidum]|uniref:Exportin-T n=1 Tax=Geotrichum candidum TaxID=1173061 RepID=A0A0J9X770_GEOCN|nr:similar to Saccharomyces cerevisiae YKL205W LOS1 Nuclear pore protein involved in nuclear export of pre-tRNA and in re-export of mature tRNAs after their retrograde import from the cytoplasm [Geotrichum candidum]